MIRAKQDENKSIIAVCGTKKEVVAQIQELIKQHGNITLLELAEKYNGEFILK